MTRVLLVQACFSYKTENKDYDATMPLGLIYIGTMLEKYNHKVKIFDRNLGDNIKNEVLIKELKRFDPDIVGISTMTGRVLYDALNVSKVVKENSNALVIWGGFHPTAVPRNTLEHPLVDHIVRGEGEYTMLEIANLIEKGRDISKVKGLDLNPFRSFANLDELPFPNYDLVNVKNYDMFYISTSRGCPYRCAFCYNNYLWGKKRFENYRNLSTQNSIELITRLYEKYKDKRICIPDDNFPSNKKRALEILKNIQHLDLKMFIFSRVNLVNEEILKAYKKAGVWTLQMGIESGSQRVLNFLKKGTTVQQGRDAIRKCRKFKIFSGASFMIGTPDETMEDLNQTIHFIKQNPPDYIGLGIYQPLPPTETYDYCIKRGLINEPKSIEEWAQQSDFHYMTINVSKIPDDILMKVKMSIERRILYRGYLKKLFRILSEGNLPNWKRVKHAIKHLGIITFKK